MRARLTAAYRIPESARGELEEGGYLFALDRQASAPSVPGDPWRQVVPVDLDEEHVQVHRVAGPEPPTIEYTLTVPLSERGDTVFVNHPTWLPRVCRFSPKGEVTGFEPLGTASVSQTLPEGWEGILGHWRSAPGEGRAGPWTTLAADRPVLSLGRYHRVPFSRGRLQGMAFSLERARSLEVLLDELAEIDRFYRGLLGAPPPGPLHLVELPGTSAFGGRNTLWLPTEFLVVEPPGQLTANRYLDLTHEWGHRYNLAGRPETPFSLRFVESLSCYWSLRGVEERFGPGTRERYQEFLLRPVLEAARERSHEGREGSLALSDDHRTYRLRILFWLDLEAALGRPALDRSLRKVLAAPSGPLGVPELEGSLSAIERDALRRVLERWQEEDSPDVLRAHLGAGEGRATPRSTRR